DAPEELGMRAGVGDLHRAGGRDDFGFQQSGGGHAVVLREASEAAALNEARHANGRATAALDIAPALGRYRIVDMHPNRSRANADRRLRGDLARAAPANESVMQRDS